MNNDDENIIPGHSSQGSQGSQSAQGREVPMQEKVAPSAVPPSAAQPPPPVNPTAGTNISMTLMKRLVALGIIHTGEVRGYNVGDSDYAKHTIQPWAISIDWNLNPWDADIVKRTLRNKESDSRKLDYQKVIHICQERIRQIDAGLD